MIDKTVVSFKDVNVEEKVSPPPTFLQDIFGKFKVVSAAPTNIPRNAYEQIVIYSLTTDVRLYIYDPTNGWKYRTFNNT